MVDQDTWAAGGWPSATNNIGELTALLRLLVDTQAAGFGDQHLVVLADSQYVINSVTKWMAGWKRKGWKKADGSPVANQELMEQIDRAMQGRDVRFEWVRGHAGHSLNEAADKRARAAAEAFRAGRAPNTGPGFGVEAALNGALAVPPARTSAPTRRLAAAGGSSVPNGAVTPPLDSMTSGNRPGSRDGTASSQIVADGGPGTGKRDRDAPARAGEGLIDALPAGEAVDRWDEVLEAARIEPVTITQVGRPSLVLMDADMAWQALAALDETHQNPEPGVLF